jgi:hypothetical protein
MPADPDRSEQQTRQGEPPVRIISTGDTEWRVYEQLSPYDRRRRADLVFESEDVIRRVRNYPLDWMELTDDALLAVSWER